MFRLKSTLQLQLHSLWSLAKLIYVSGGGCPCHRCVFGGGASRGVAYAVKVGIIAQFTKLQVAQEITYLSESQWIM